MDFVGEAGNAMRRWNAGRSCNCEPGVYFGSGQRHQDTCTNTPGKCPLLQRLQLEQMKLPICLPEVALDCRPYRLYIFVDREVSCHCPEGGSLDGHNVPMPQCPNVPIKRGTFYFKKVMDSIHSCHCQP